MSKKERYQNFLLPSGRVVDKNYGNPKRPRPTFDLCGSCVYSRLTCPNQYNREVRVPLENDDDPSLEIKKIKRGENRNVLYSGAGEKVVDGVKAGIYKKEEDIPIAERCGDYIPKGYEHIFFQEENGDLIEK